MEKFLCADCNRKFDELKDVSVYKEPFYHTMKGCPYCGSTDIYDRVNSCTICGESIYQEEKYYYCSTTKECFCENCIDERMG